MFCFELDQSYDADGEILTWTKNYSGLAAPQRFDLGYDNANQLTTAPLKNASTNALIKQYTYGYDAGSNRTSETVATTTTTSTPNTVNEITSQSGGVNRTLTYDLNGSITSDGGTRTFEWDGANRLVAINYTGFTTRSEFTYDGLSRVAKIIEKTGGTINSTRKFVWSGQEKLEFRDATDAVTQRNYSQGNMSAPPPTSTRAIISARSAKCSPAAAPLLLVMTTIPTDAQPPCSEPLPPISILRAFTAIRRAISIWRHIAPTIRTWAGG